MQKKVLYGGILFLAIIIISLIAITRPTYEFPRNSAGPEIQIEIASGESGWSIARQLEKNGVIMRASKFAALAAQDKRALSISPGTHRVQTHITTKDALTQLLDQTRLGTPDVVVEGSTYSDVLKVLAADSNIVTDKKVVMPALKNPKNSLEGQLFPATYTFASGTSRSTALQTMVKNFEEKMRAIGLERGYSNFTPYQVLTIASMVQIEGDPSDYAKVAGVIYNRLKIGMPLQLNSTVQYAANLRGRIFLSTQATKIDSPYNTYKHVGLPPTPISNPSFQALKASLNPQAHNYLYFITVKPRDTRFTADYSEFGRWVEEYNKNLAAGKFR